MSEIEHIPVQIGEVKVGREGQSLNAILGSCIGVGFLHPNEGVFGLAHVLLAKSSEEDCKGEGRNVDDAVESLLRKMAVKDDQRRRLQVFIAGGANMTQPADTDPRRLVGTVNANYARKALKKARLRLVHDDTGGMCGRRVTLDCSAGEFSVAQIPRLSQG